MHISNTSFDQAKKIAAKWQKRIAINQDKSELKFHAMMKRMLKNPMNKIFLIELLDQSFRAKNKHRIADQLEYLFSKYDDSDFFTPYEQLLVWLFRHLGIYLPVVSVPMFIRYLRNDISNIVIKGETSPLIEHIRRRREEHTRVNINIIGEAVLGEMEAKGRIDKYIKALEHPEIDYISIKISTIFSQITPHAHKWSVEQICRRLEMIYAAAMEHPFTDSYGEGHYKFVNLDMEEYRDVRLTVDAFMETLSREPFLSLHAGIALQAYLPDTFEILRKLSVWAKERVKNGGAPIKVRLVKGANQEMELTEASLRGWPCVTYTEKAQTDANYKILMDYLLSPDIAPYLHTGLASHNLFDHALGMLLARERGVEAYYTAEMLEGMSESAYRLLKKEGVNVILYAPTATEETFTNAIAYLVRRFDENTAEQNFLRHSFGLNVGSDAWKQLLRSYEEAVRRLPDTPLEPFRTQNRNIPHVSSKIQAQNDRFSNEPDTDFTLPQNRVWGEKIRDKWKNIHRHGGFHASAVIGGEKIFSQSATEVIDKSQYHDRVTVGTYGSASAEDLAEAVRIAQADPDGWRELEPDVRQQILIRVADEFRKSRGDLIGIAAAEVGKIFTETDVEVSEAIDFLHFYPYSVNAINDLNGIHASGKGVGLIISPWNFPIAIPTGGIAAALASGNTVILKPSSNAVLCAYRLCQCFWDAGVSKNTLQFVPCSGSLAGNMLISDPAVDFVIFTGGELTAYEMLRIRPSLHLNAETGGKDATIVTALADRDQAVKNITASAFNNSGQKCSATSLLVLEREIYEDEHFKRMLLDAASSLEVGSVWEFKNRIGPLITPPSGNLKRSLDSLERMESWLLPPAFGDRDNPYMLKPSIRWGTQKGDFCHMNELFGPVLSVMCADNLEEAIDIVNATGYGLTSGLESLDEREQRIWKETLLAGNLYINRPTTGAIVRRQPFGGMRKSSIGSGKKAGGFNYVTQFMNLTYDGSDRDHTADHPYIERIQKYCTDSGPFDSALRHAFHTAGNFAYWLDTEFMQIHDYSNIRGESNTLCYRHVESILFRFEETDTLYEMFASIIAAKIAGAKLIISLPKSPQSSALHWITLHSPHFLDSGDICIHEDQNTLLDTIDTAQRIRFLHPENVSPDIYKHAAAKAVYIATEPFVAHGRIELMHYFIEQSISHSYHRYGNLGLRGLEEKEKK